MKYRKFGKTSMNVSEIGLGCWQLGGHQEISGQGISYGNLSEEDAINLVQNALKLGINTFDTADSYSFGASETRLGKALSDKRKDVFIFTKAGYVPFADSIFEIDISYHNLIASLKRSLKRLNTDYVDLFQVHQIPRTENDFKEIEKAFLELKGTGEIKYCGISIAKEIDVGLELIQRELVDSLQMYFSILDYQPAKKLFFEASKNGVGVIAAKPLSQGFLTGKFSGPKTFSNNDTRNRLSSNEIQERIRKVNQIKSSISSEKSLSRISIAYILSFNEVSTCIPGAKNLEQLKENVTSGNIELTSKEMNKIKEIQQYWEK